MEYSSAASGERRYFQGLPRPEAVVRIHEITVGHIAFGRSRWVAEIGTLISISRLLPSGRTLRSLQDAQQLHPQRNRRHITDLVEKQYHPHA